jgi:hypothetical protein
LIRQAIDEAHQRGLVKRLKAAELYEELIEGDSTPGRLRRQLFLKR